MRYKLGIDVGGTNTDAVLISEDLEVKGSVKVPTSNDIYSGIVDSIRQLLKANPIDKDSIFQTMLGTTQCTNAIVERKNLAPVGVIRLAAPASTGIPPMVDWETELASTVVDYYIAKGGYEYNGKEINSFDEDEVRSFFRKIKGKVESVAISCCFASIRNEHEKRAAKICKEEMGEDVHVSISSEIGSMGLIERENATILNAALYKVARSFTEGFQKSLADEGITKANLYLSQNDGTLMTMEEAKKYPVLTIACGPTNSIRGANYLCKSDDAVVIDVGGTTTDIGVILHGFPRQSSQAAEIGGVRTNFRMPDVISIGLGGGSIVRQRDDGSVTVGPDSVGYKLTKKALVFGGDTLTTTDIAVAAGMYDLGDKSKVSNLDPNLVKKAVSTIKAMVEDSVDAIKISSDPVPVILVGGGSIIVPEVIVGAASITKPNFFGTANAIGSAISKVSGNYEALVSFDKTPREEALENAKKEATALALKAGAKEGTVEIIDVEDVPLAYYPGNTSRIKVKAAGDLA